MGFVNQAARTELISKLDRVFAPRPLVIFNPAPSDRVVGYAVALMEKLDKKHWPLIEGLVSASSGDARATAQSGALRCVSLVKEMADSVGEIEGSSHD